MRVNPFVIPVLAVLALLGSVMTAQAFGLWATNGRAGTDLTRLMPADLKGWMTLQDVMSGLKISKDDLYAAGKIPSDTLVTTPLNKLEAIVPGFSVTTLRETLTARLGMSSPSASPSSVNTSGEPAKTPAARPVETPGTPASFPVGQVLPASQIKGKMSLQEVSDQCKVPLSRFLGELRLDPDTDPQALIKDLVGQGKLAEVTLVQQVVEKMQREQALGPAQ